MGVQNMVTRWLCEGMVVLLLTITYLTRVPAILMHSKTAISSDQFQFPKCRLYFNIAVYNQNQNSLWNVFDANIYSNILISA